MIHNLHYSCKHYFGSVIVEAETRDEAKLLAKDKIKCDYQSTPTTRAECKKTCGLKFRK
jgi:hypothetical protein